MAVAEQLTTRVSFFGRLTDDVTRQPLTRAEMSVGLVDQAQTAICKDDGHFALVDLEPSAAGYRVRLGGPSYQDRVVTVPLPATAPVQMNFPGEDELYVRISSITATQNRVGFEAVGFVRTIPAGAQAIGEGGVTTTLVDAIEGLSVQSAVLTSIAGLSVTQLLRFVRSSSLVVRPSPYYPFPPQTTVVAVHAAENDLSATPIADIAVAITKLNGATPAATSVGGLSLNQFALGGAPASFVVLDDMRLTTATNERGDAIFYLPGEKAVTSMEIALSKPQFQSATATITVTAGQRTFQKVVMNRV